MAPAVLAALLRKMDHQRLADPLAAMLRSYEQVLQIKAGLAAERRKIQEPERKADRRAIPLGHVAEHARGRCKQRRVDHRFGRDAFVGELFVFGKLADELEDEP